MHGIAMLPMRPARRFGIGVGTVYRIEKMFNASGKSLEEFRNLEPTEAS